MKLDICFIGGFVVEEPVEESNVNDTGNATSYADVGYAMTTASQPSRSQTMNMPCQQVEGQTTVVENKGYTSRQFSCILQRLFKDDTVLDVQVAKSKRTTNDGD